MNSTNESHPKELELDKQPFVMIVDDSEIDNFVNDKILRRYGFSDRIIILESSMAALQYLQDADKNKTEIPSIIFLDLNMPIMNGALFIEKFEELPVSLKSNCKIIILSNSGNPYDKSSMLSNKNVFAFFSKPLIKDNLDHLSIELVKKQEEKSILKRKPENVKETIGSIHEQVKKSKTSFLSFLGWPVPFNYDTIQK